MCNLFRKFLASSAAAMLLAMPLTAQASAEKFNDVRPSAWYYDAVDYATDEGMFNGTSQTTFSPDSSMTRGMFVTVLANKTGGYNAAWYGASSFTDVPIGQWYAAPVEWAYQSNLVGGVGNGKFAPNTSVTREQIAKILYDYAQRTGNDTTVSPTAMQGFVDADSVSSWARQAMEWATTHKVIQGDGGRLNPQGTATRAQVAQIFYNCRGLLVNTEIQSPRRTWVVDVPGHYESRERLELKEVKVGEVGHWEDGYITEWVYRCNKCGFIASTVEGINHHLDDSFDWETMTGCGSYTMVSGEPIYTGEKFWIVDVPGKSEYQWVVVTEQVWVEEAGHWE